MTALVTKHLPLVAGAPDGIKRLRALILDLAVRGRLVPQKSTEASASELIVQMQADQARLLSRGDIRRARKSEPVDPKDFPFEVPYSWQWVRLASIGHDLGQAEPSADFTYIDVGSVNNRTGVIQSPQVLSASEAPSRARKVVRSGSVIYSTIRPYLLNVAVIEHDFCPPPIASTAFAIIQPYPGLLARYLFWWLRSETFIKYVESVQTGIAYPAINDGQFFNGLMPLPPFEEQHRIVEKVDELMALCDRLEADQADAEAAHAQLVQTLLDSLTQATDAADFRVSWQRLSEHFHTLFTTEASIDALKQTVLQLAVMGKLVPQIQRDGSAMDLLASIATTGKSKAPVAPAIGESLPALPPSWCWIRIADLAHVGTGATPSRTNPAYFDPPEISWVTSGETSQAFVRSTEQKVSLLALNETNLTVYPVGTLVVAMYGQGKTRGQVTELLIEACTNQACAAIQLICDDSAHRKFVKYFFEKSYDELRSLAAGGAQPNLNLGKIKETLIPLPPLAEQHRIVEKVDELMALCDLLKAGLTESRQLHGQLATALVEQAVA